MFQWPASQVFFIVMKDYMVQQESSNAPISLVSSYATDRWIDSAGLIVTEQQGGPAYFIERALVAEGIGVDVHAGEPFLVDIIQKQGDETGKAAFMPPTKRIETATLHDWTIVSTIGREWTFAPQLPLPAHLCVDIQGFVRGDEPGQKRPWSDIAGIVPHVFCLKGTSDEIAQLSPDVLRAQKHERLLVVTHAEQGAEVFVRGTHFELPGEHISNLKTTVGAGDTFFAYFVAALYEAQDVPRALEHAVKLTSSFLGRPTNVLA